MIPDLLIKLVFGTLTALTDALPAFSGPFSLAAGSQPGDAMRDFGGYISGIRGWVDVDLLFTVFQLVVTIMAVYGTVFVVLWVYNHMPGKSS